VICKRTETGIMIIDILEKSKVEKGFVGIWLYNDDDGFWSGVVQDYTDELVILQHYTKYGKPDGLIIEQISNIESIDFGDDYAKVMEFLIENAHLLDQQPKVALQIKDPAYWQKSILEDFIGDKDTIVRVQINNDSYFSGLVDWCDDESLILEMIGTEGQDEGKSLFKMDDITAIRVNDLENRKKLLLYKWRLSRGDIK